MFSKRHSSSGTENLYAFIDSWLCQVFVAGGLFSSCGNEGCSLVAVLGLLIAVASFVAEHRL